MGNPRRYVEVDADGVRPHMRGRVNELKQLTESELSDVCSEILTQHLEDIEARMEALRSAESDPNPYVHTKHNGREAILRGIHRTIGQISTGG